MSERKSEFSFLDKSCPACGEVGSLIKVREPLWIKMFDEQTYVWAATYRCSNCEKYFHGYTMALREIPPVPPAYP